MSSHQGKEFVLTEYAKNLIGFKSRQLSLRRDFCRSDREEIQQELWLAVVGQADRFDPSRASLDSRRRRALSSTASKASARARSVPKPQADFRANRRRLGRNRLRQVPAGDKLR